MPINMRFLYNSRIWNIRTYALLYLEFVQIFFVIGP